MGRKEQLRAAAVLRKLGYVQKVTKVAAGDGRKSLKRWERGE